MTNRTNRQRISLQVSQPVRCCLKAVFVGGDDGEQGMCGHGEQGPALPGDPAADLVFVEPGQALPAWKDSSTVHRLPATRTSSRSGTGSGESQR
jgi:hypothetical protein